MLSCAAILESSQHLVLPRYELAQLVIAHALELVGRAVLNLIDPHPQLIRLA
jgi:hypothetical protein